MHFDKKILFSQVDNELNRLIDFEKVFVYIEVKYSMSGVPNGAARQNTRSSGRIWASWKKKPWQISWLGNLNKRLASRKCEKFMPVLAG